MKAASPAKAALAFLSRVALYEGTWEKFHNGGQKYRTYKKDLLNTAAQAAHDVMAGGAFELFAPQELGTGGLQVSLYLGE